MLEEALDGVREVPLKGFLRAVASLRDAGAQVEERSVEAVGQAWPLSPCLYNVEAAGQWIEVIEANHGCDVQRGAKAIHRRIGLFRNRLREGLDQAAGVEG